MLRKAVAAEGAAARTKTASTWPDRYIYVRSAYLQRRRSLVYDGNPPREPDPGPTSKSSPSGASPAQTAVVSPPQRRSSPPGEPSVAGARPQSYEPVVPRNYSAVLDVSGEASGSLKPTGLRP